jgi:hypothetical protein
MNIKRDIPFPINFAFIGKDGEEIPDKEFQARCYCVPRKGELVVPMAGSPEVIVTDVIYRLIKSTAFPGEMIMVPTVVLEEPNRR